MRGQCITLEATQHLIQIRFNHHARRFHCRQLFKFGSETFEVVDYCANKIAKALSFNCDAMFELLDRIIACVELGSEH